MQKERRQMRIAQIATGGKPPQIKRKYRDLDSRLHVLENRLRNEEMDNLVCTDATFIYGLHFIKWQWEYRTFNCC